MSYMFASHTSFVIRTALYDCIIPELATMNPAYIEQFGVHSTGDAKLDQALEGRRMRTKLTILGILNYFLNGIDIVIIGDKAKLAIHKYIQTYLEEWNKYLEVDINSNANEYMEYLRNLQSLSTAIYNLIPNKIIEDKIDVKKSAPLVLTSVNLAEAKRAKQHQRLNYEDRYGSIIKMIHNRTINRY